MGTKTVTITSCDRCGLSTESKIFESSTKSGKIEVKLEGQLGGKTYAGDWGGSSYLLSSLLCFDCGKEFLDIHREFMLQNSQKCNKK